MNPRLKAAVSWTLLVILSGMLAGACGAGQVPPPPLPTQRLDRQAAQDVAARADELRSAVLAGAPAGDLVTAFRGQALQSMRGRAEGMARRGFRLEERAATRALVSWDPSVREAVLQVEAQDRLVTPDQPDPAWSATARQVWSRIDYADGAWWVVETLDLGPDRWL